MDRSESVLFIIIDTIIIIIERRKFTVTEVINDSNIRLRSGIFFEFHEVFNNASEGGIVTALSEVINSASCPYVSDVLESIVSVSKLHIIGFHAEDVELRSGAMKQARKVLFRGPDGDEIFEGIEVEIESVYFAIFAIRAKQIEVRFRFYVGAIALIGDDGEGLRRGVRDGLFLIDSVVGRYADFHIFFERFFIEIIDCHAVHL